jgi:nitrous oxidase accessory protein NosD
MLWLDPADPESVAGTGEGDVFTLNVRDVVVCGLRVRGALYRLRELASAIDVKFPI